MRYQTKLLLAFGLLLVMALIAAGLSYQGMDRSRYHLERSRLAHEVLGGYLQLSSDTYQLFKQLADALLIGDRDLGAGEADLLQRLEDDLARLRSLIGSEVAFVDEEELEGEKQELAQLARIERKIAQVVREFSEVETLREEGQGGVAWAKLTGLLDESIDTDFNHMIADVIAGEAEEVAATDQEARALLDRLKLSIEIYAAIATLSTIAAVVLLLRGMRRPLTQLVAGTQALATGDLSHRIVVDGQDEFAQLSRNFNRMAADLERHQTKLRDAQGQLEQAVAERTEELRRANAALAAADGARRRFFADVSHELRTPLTIMRGESEIALRGDDKTAADYKAALQRILEQAGHTARLVDDLLFIARQDAGETRMTVQAVALSDLVHMVCEDMRGLATERGLALVERTAVDGAVVSGDAGRLRQLFLILIDNAVRYSRPHQTVTVDISPSSRGVAVRVADQGIGIPPDERERVFERFYRGDNAAEHHIDGTGLGLPVAKAIVEAHKGSITVESEIEAGTAVTVTLPTVRKLRAVA